MPKKSRYILLPFSFIYGGIIWMRNQLFDKKFFRSATFDFPLICIGNLSVGGTGKTPMVEYLVSLLNKNFKTATLSRGYKRKTKGFLIADENSKATDIGDEPMQIHKKFPGITVAVAEERVIGIPQLLFSKPETEVIILDDAFQHREVTAGLNILLTDYNNLYSNDFLLPVGNLRDVKKSSERADIIVVTKCKSNLNIDEKQSVINELRPQTTQTIFFTSIEYGSPYHLFSTKKYNFDKETSVLLLCGIANPKPIESEVKSKIASYQMLRFNDHHIYDSFDLKKIKDEFSNIESSKKIILTTEKDATRLFQFENELKDLPIYVLPMAHHFLFGDETKFENEILDFVNSFKRQRIDKLE
jgi:tetraacyldisaccharide 4'-kinase